MASEVASETSNAYNQACLALTFKFAALVSAKETVMRGSWIYLVKALVINRVYEMRLRQRASVRSFL
jgi:hypothetical protein